MAKRNQVTADLRINATAELNKSRSFVNQLDKIIDKFDFGTKINNQLSDAERRLKDCNKILEKVQNKSFVSDDELKKLVKAGKEIANIVAKTEKIYSGFSQSDWKKYSKEYINQVKAQEQEIAKIKDDYSKKTGKSFDKDLANYDKVSAKIKQLQKEKEQLAKNGAIDLTTKEIEKLNQKLDEQKNKFAEIKKIQTEAAKAYNNAVEAESKKRGYNSYNDIKNTKILSDSQIKKQLGNAEYKQQATLVNQLEKDIKQIGKAKSDNNELDKAAIQLAEKYNLKKVSTYKQLKEQLKMQKDLLRSVRDDKSRLANEKEYAAVIANQNQLLKDRAAIEQAGKDAELKVIQQGGYSSKSSLTAISSSTNRSISNLEGQLTESGIENIANNSAQIVAAKIENLNSKISEGVSFLKNVDSTNEKLATQSERTADEDDIKSMGQGVNKNLDKTENGINKYTNMDNSRISAEIEQNFTRERIKQYRDETFVGLEDTTSPIFSSPEVLEANEKLVTTQIDQLFDQVSEAINGKGNLAELENNVDQFIELTGTIKYTLEDEIEARKKVTAQAIADIDAKLKTAVPGSHEAQVLQLNKEDSQQTLNNEIEKFTNSLNSADKMSNSFKAILDLIKAERRPVGNISEEFIKLGNNIEKAAERSQYLGSTFDDFKNKVGYFLSLNYVIDQIGTKIKEANDFTKNLDKDMLQIGLVLGQSSSQTWKNFDTYAKMADRLNTTVSDVTASMKLFYQQGLNTVEVNKMVEASAIAAALGETSMAEASETLTSIINGYNLTASQAVNVTDKISMVAMVSAADFGEISTAIEKVASSASSAGLDLDHLMGYLAKMIETTREAPTNIGTALKTIVANFTQFKEDPSGLGEEGTAINNVDTALKSVGISLTNAQGDVRDLGDVLDELGKKWNSLTRNQKSYLATQIAGTRQQSRFYALMNDYDRTLQLVSESTNSSGKAASQFALYQSSLSASTERLNNEWEKFYNNILKNDTALKTFSNTATGLLQIANKLGAIPTTVLGGSALAGLRTLFVQFSKFKAEVKESNEQLLQTGNLIRKNNLGKNVFEGYSFNGLKNNWKATSSENEKIGSNMANAIFSWKGGKEDLSNLSELLELQKNLKDNNLELVKSSSVLNEVFQTTGEVTDTLIEKNKEQITTRLEDTISTQVNTVQHKVSSAVKWSEVAAQVALNLAVMAGVALVAGAITGIVALANARHKEALAAQESAKSAEDEYNSLETLVKKYQDLSSKINLTDSERQELSDTIENLKSEYPDLIDYIDQEGKAYIKSNSALQDYLNNKRKIAAEEKAKAAKKNLTDTGGQKDTAYDNKNVLWKGSSKTSDDKFIGSTTKSAAKDLQDTVESLISGSDLVKTTLAAGDTYKNKNNVNRSYFDIDALRSELSDTGSIKDARFRINKMREAVSETNIMSSKYINGISNEDRKEYLAALDKLNQQIDDLFRANVQDYSDLASDIYNENIVKKQISGDLTDEQASLAKNLLTDYYKEQFNSKGSGEEMRKALENGELDEGVNQILTDVQKLSVDEIKSYDDLIKSYKSGEISLEDLQRELKDYSANLKNYGQKFIKEANDEIEKMLPDDVDYGTAGGNIDLNNRPIYHQPDGSVSTVESISFKDVDGLETLIPKIIKDANGNAVELSDDEAIQHYKETGEYLGKFQNALEADTYALELHEQQAKVYEGGKNNKADLKQERLENLKGMKGSTRTLLANAKDSMRNENGKGFNKDAFNSLYNRILEDDFSQFQQDLDNLDTTDLGEVRKFKKEYANKLGQYGEDFLDAILKNPAYNAEETQKKLNTAYNGMTTKNKNGVAYSDIASGSVSQEDASNELTNSAKNARRNIQVIGKDLIVTGKEIADSFLQSQEDAQGALDEIIVSADENIKEYQKQLDGLDAKGIDNLNDKEKEQYNTLSKNIVAEQNRIKQANKLAKAYSKVSIEEQGILDNQQVITGFSAVNKEVNSLKDLADMYQYVGKARMSQLDIIQAVAENTDLLTSLEVNERGELELNKLGIEAIAAERIAEAKAAVDAQIQQLEAMKTYIDADVTYTQAELQNIAATAEQYGNSSEDQQQALANEETAMNTNLQATKTWQEKLKGLLAKAVEWWNSLWKAADGSEQTIDGESQITNVKKTNVIDFEGKTTVTGQEAIDKINAQIEKLKAISGKLSDYQLHPDKLLNDVNKMGDYKSSGGGSSAKDAFDAMVEKLEHFYNYLRQIEALESKISKIQAKRGLIDATQNYFLDNLAQENALLKEQSALYGNYIKDEKDYLAAMRDSISSLYGDWAYFNKEGIIQVKQTEFNINSEDEQKRYEEFSEILSEYQNEYNTMLENQNKLYEIQSTVVENINSMYDKQLQKLKDISERLEYINSISEHRVTMEFGSIKKLDLINDQVKTTAKMLENAQSSVNALGGDFNTLSKIVEQSAFKSLLTWDETLQKYLVNNSAMENENIRKQFEAQGYNWESIVTWVNATAGASQKITDNLKEANTELMNAQESLKSLLDDRLSTIDEIFSKATDEIDKFYKIYEDKISKLTTNNDLFGTESSNLEQQYTYLTSMAQHAKALLGGLQKNSQSILNTIMKDYGSYVQMVDGTAYINKMAIEESSTLTEKQKADLLQLYELYTDSQDQIEEVNSKFYDYISQIKDLEEAKRDAIIDLKNQLYDALKEKDQKEIDDLSEKYQKMNQLDSEYYSKLQQRISDARNARSRLQEQQNLTQMQNRLATLQQDNSGQYNSEMIELQKQINEQLQNQADQNVDLELERIAREQEQRQEDREMQITQMENLLTFKDENGIYWQETQDIIENGNASVIGKLMESEEIQKMSKEEQAKQFESLESQVETANADFTSVYQDEMGWQTSDIRQGLKDFVEAPLDKIPGEISSSAGQIKEQIVNGTKTFINTMSALFKYLDELTGKTEAKGYTTGILNDNGIYTAPTKKPDPAPSVPAAPAAPPQSQPSLAKGSYVQVKSGTRWYYDSYGTNPSGRARSGTIKYINPKGSHPYNIEGLGWVKKTDIVGYNKGGYVNYTGIAAVHGKANKPEAFLNARQTALFETLRDALVKVPTSINTKETDNSETVTIENLAINVKELADTDSIDKVVRTVKESIYKDAVTGNNMKITRRR